jgi:phenylpropionate dioxygenase-like ring-hydroxylating dioxygenase large terminal subunit
MDYQVDLFPAEVQMIPDPVLVDDWHPVLRSDDVVPGKPLGVRLLGEDLVLWRADGVVRAWQDLCVHRGTRLSLGVVQDHTLACPYHGWTYDVSGRCIHIPAHPDQSPPAKARVKVYQAQERYGMVWVSLGVPTQDIPYFPEEPDDSFRKLLTGPFPPVRANGPRIIENFLDVTHFPFVHAGILGDPARPEISDYRVETGEQGILARDVVTFQPDPYGTKVGDTVSYTYRVFRPLTAYLEKDAPDGSRMTLMLTLTPHDELSTSAWFYAAVNDKINATQAEWDEFQLSIFSQDVPIVESQRPELLPLDLQAEMHLRSDRLAIAYRRWLKELGLTYGIS